MSDLAVYIHWPYCQSKCPYCDFNSHVSEAIDHGAFKAAYRSQIAYYAEKLPNRSVGSIFFGGGTPSLMEPATVDAVISELNKHMSFDDDIEITLEANPGSSEAAKFTSFRAAGVNRLSLGVQSLRDEALKFLGRAHDSKEAKTAIALAQKTFPRSSFDLIYARHGQSLQDWETELIEALALAANHLSLYQLTIEQGTQFYTLSRRQELTAPLEMAATMFDLTQDILTAAGLPAYEVSNHARRGDESRHNKTYWHYEDYIGIGPGAHGRYLWMGQRVASEDHKSPALWLDQVKEKANGISKEEVIDDATAQREALMMGLRLKEGIDHVNWREKFGAALCGQPQSLLSLAKVERLLKENYLSNDEASLKATSEGFLRLNAMLGYLLA